MAKKYTLEGFLEELIRDILRPTLKSKGVTARLKETKENVAHFTVAGKGQKATLDIGLLWNCFKDGGLIVVFRLVAEGEEGVRPYFGDVTTWDHPARVETMVRTLVDRWLGGQPADEPARPQASAERNGNF